jgi:hypothetical protein
MDTRHRHLRQFGIVCLTSLVCILAGCSGGSKSSPAPENNPAPTVTSLSPATALAGAASQTLTINGTNFLSSSSVTFNGTAHTATYVSASQLTISLSASDEATAGNYGVVVTNPSPGGGASSAVNFTVDNPVPTVTGISPATVMAGAAGQTVTVTGTNFVATTTVTFNGTAATPTIVSATQLTIPVTAAEETSIGSFAIVAANPSPGGGSAAPVNFTVTGPVLAGVVYKGASAGSTVTAYELNADGSDGTAIGTASTGPDGSFSLGLTALPPGAVRLTATGGTYASEFDASTITGTSGVSALLDTATASVSGISITPASEFVSSYAGGLLSAKTVTDEPTAHKEAAGLIGGYLGLSSAAVIETLTPVFDKPDITADPDGFTLGLFVGALATEGKSAVPTSPDDLIAALSADISDGVFDGKAGGTAVPLVRGVESKIRIKPANAAKPSDAGAGTLSPTAGTTDLLLALGTYITTGSSPTAAGIALTDTSTLEEAIFGGVSGCSCTPPSSGLLATSSGATTSYSLNNHQYLILAARQEGVVVVDITDPTTKTPPINAWPSISANTFGGADVGGVVAVTGLSGHPQVIAFAYESTTISVLNLDTLITGNPATDNPVDLTATLTLAATSPVGFSGGSAFIAGGIPDNGRGGVWLDTADGYGLLKLSSLVPGATSVALSTLYPVEDTGEIVAENMGGDIANDQLLGGNYGGVQLVDLSKGKSYYLPAGNVSSTLTNFAYAYGEVVDGDSVDGDLRVGILTSEDQTAAAFLDLATVAETDSTTSGTLNALAPASGGLVQVVLGGSGGYYGYGPVLSGSAVDKSSHLALFMAGYSTDIAVGQLQDPSSVAAGASWAGLTDWVYFTLTDSPELSSYNYATDPHSVGVVYNQTTKLPYGYLFDGSTDRGIVQIDLSNFLGLARAGTTGDAAHMPAPTVDPGATTAATGGLVLQEFTWTDPTTPISAAKKKTQEDLPRQPMFTPRKK